MKYLLIIIGIIVLVVITRSFLTKKTEIQNELKDQKNVSLTDVSTFDINVKIPKPDSNLKELWINEMENIGLQVEFHPEFDIKNHSGFLPLKIKVTDSNYTKKYGNNQWIAGFELYISKFDSEEYFSYFEKNELNAMPKNEKEIYDNAKLDFFFSVKPQHNIANFRVGWFAASTLAKVSNGILEEAYSGKNYISNSAIEVAKNKTKDVEIKLPDGKWNLKKFNGWN